MNQSKYKVCSLFSGIGGIDLGFKQAGFDVVWANEIDKYAAETYKKNFGNETLVVKDLRKIHPKEIPDFDVLVAGFPCQSFSAAGKQRGFNDERGQLFFEIVRVVEEKQPEIIFLENVANLLEHDEGKTFLTVYNELVPFGYSFKYCVMDAQEYGNIPQHRERIFIVAFKDIDKCERFSFPEKIELTNNLNDIIDRTQKHNDCYYYHEGDPIYDKLKPSINNMSVVYRIRNNGDDIRKYRICPTLTASMGSFQSQIPVIRDSYGIRKLTPYECLALQGFPQGFKFPKIPLDSAYKQCGNSVVVPVIRRIAKNIMQVIKSGY